MHCESPKDQEHTVVQFYESIKNLGTCLKFLPLSFIILSFAVDDTVGEIDD
jgi:hypothetical protein